MNTNKKYKNILLSIICISIALIFISFAFPKPNSTTYLTNQKTDIDNSFMLKKIEKINNFEPWCFTNDDRVIGCYDSKIFSKKPITQKLAIYNLKTKELKILDESKPDLSIESCLGFINDNILFYKETNIESLFDTSKRLCFLNIKDDSIFEITNNATAYSSSAKNNNILYAKGFKLFKSDLDGNSKEIILSNEVLQALKKPHYKNIDDFYKNSYNKDYYDEDDYFFMVNNNCISSINYYKKNLIELKTLDEKRIFYNLDDKSFKVFYDKAEAKKYKNRILKNTEDKNNKKLYKIEENENYKKLYSLDENFDKKNLIDQGKIFIESISKNNKKIAYKKSINNESKLFIYDFVKDKKTQIFLPDFNVMRWNDDENILLVETDKYDQKESCFNYYTYIVYMYDSTID